MNTKLTLLKETLKNCGGHEELMEIPNFPDKTLFIKEVFNCEFKKIIITAPSGFGKTTNLKLLEKFLAIPIQKNGLIEDRNNCANYRFFKDNNLKIFQDKEFFEENFGTHPVVYFVFQNYASCFQEMIHKCRVSLVQLFYQRPYLLTSRKLSAEEINQFKKYYNFCIHKILTKTEIVEGLEFLCKCLSKHFDDKKVFLLIDDYDQPISWSMFNKGFDSVRRVHGLFRQILLKTVNCEFVEKAVLAGVHCFNYFGSPVESDDITKYQFLVDNPFTQYHGLTEPELDNFFRDFQVEVKAMEKFKNCSNSYASLQGTKLFPIGSLLYFIKGYAIQSPKTFHHWATEFLYSIKLKLDELCHGEPFPIEILPKLDIEHVTKLQHIFLTPSVLNLRNYNFCVHLFLNFLLQFGYLTFENNSCHFKLVNNMNMVRRPKFFNY